VAARGVPDDLGCAMSDEHGRHDEPLEQDGLFSHPSGRARKRSTPAVEKAQRRMGRSADPPKGQAHVASDSGRLGEIAVADLGGRSESVALPTRTGDWHQHDVFPDGAEFPGDAAIDRTPTTDEHAEWRGRRMRRGWLVRRLLVGADVIGLAVAIGVVQLSFNGSRLIFVGIGSETVLFVAAIPTWIFFAKLYGLYDRDEEHATYSTADELLNVFHLITVGVWLFYASLWLLRLESPSQRKLVAFWLLAIVAVTTARAAARAVARRQSAYLQNTIILGAGEIGQLVGRKIVQHPEYGINLIGFVDAEPRERREDLGDLQLVGRPHDLEQIVRRDDIDRVIVAFSNDGHEELLSALRPLRKHDVQIDVVPRLFEFVNPRVTIHTVEGLPLLGLPAARIPRSSRFLKRCLDIVGASVLLVLAAPLMLVIAFFIRRDSPGPVLFRQTRLGIDMREFTLLKFRTMRVGTDDAPHREYIGSIMDSSALPMSGSLYKLERAEAVTCVGRWLRATSLDELPQLFNVLRGDMSLVGPRPCIPYEIEFFAPHHFERFLVPAGITGLWQVEARAHSTFGEALELDALYARGWSLGLDLRLLARTPLLMFRKRETD
jgi:exopolysaccharide biosynthesis polyprenyl glycosylphosphotransferase